MKSVRQAAVITGLAALLSLPSQAQVPATITAPSVKSPVAKYGVFKENKKGKHRRIGKVIMHENEIDATFALIFRSTFTRIDEDSYKEYRFLPGTWGEEFSFELDNDTVWKFTRYEARRPAHEKELLLGKKAGNEYITPIDFFYDIIRGQVADTTKVFTMGLEYRLVHHEQPLLPFKETYEVLDLKREPGDGYLMQKPINVTLDEQGFFKEARIILTDDESNDIDLYIKREYFDKETYDKMSRNDF